MKLLDRNSFARNHATLGTIVAAILAASLMSFVPINTAVAGKGGGVRAPAAGKNIANKGLIDRVGSVRAPQPSKAKKTEPCKGKHCNWQHQH